MQFDNIDALGTLHLVLRDETGAIKSEFSTKNLVVTTGKNFLASRAAGTAQAVMSHMAIGSGTVAPVAANTTLGTELGRVGLTSSNVTNNTIQYVATFGAGVGTGAVTEAGIFNAASAGTMLNRTTFSVINKGASDTLTITWNLTLN